MTNRSSDPDTPFLMRLRLARGALLWERLWPACWPMLAVLGTFLVVGLFDLLPLLPGVLHAALLLGFGVAFTIALVAISRRLGLPDRFAAQRRIEQASGLEHRPLQAGQTRSHNSAPRARRSRIKNGVSGSDERLVMRHLVFAPAPDSPRRARPEWYPWTAYHYSSAAPG